MKFHLNICSKFTWDELYLFLSQVEPSVFDELQSSGCSCS